DSRSGRVLPKLWIHYPKPDGGTEREATHTTSIVKARQLRAKRMEEAGRGEPGRAAEKVLVNALFDDLRADYQLMRKDIPTLNSQLEPLRPAFGNLQATRCTTDVIKRVQLEWQATLPTAPINRRCNSLRRAFTLARQAGKLHVVPHVPR